ncbi:uncharacterized protein LOC123686587 [Harmonia axyridis]|uniref:uncharacterized protein LOC123686587 n=1 Tax=Harmonia axyridis TaxID=115357 RepID=UPI001E277DAC|nr:uncharacterized protein LOC123686587 [Harmonia axyridis]
MSLASNEIPSYDSLIKFVQKQSKVLSRTSTHASSSTQSKSPGAKPKGSYSYASASSVSDKIVHYPCPVCGENSPLITKCHRFLKLSPNERYQLTREKILCLNCLSSKHKISQCKSLNSCSVCINRHHSLLHFNKETPKEVKPIVNSTAESNISQSGVSLMVADSIDRKMDISHNYDRITLLPTAEVMIKVDDKLEKIRVLLDSGSQDNFLSTECCKHLKIPFSKRDIKVTGIGNISTPIRGIAPDLTIFSRFNERFQITLDALVIDNLTSKLPSYDIPLEDLSFIDNLRLADSKFSYSEKIDGILGAAIFVGILKGDKIIDRSDSLFALNTSFGYVISGKFSSCNKTNSPLYSNSFHIVVDNFALEKLLKHFIKLEEFPEKEHFSSDDLACEDSFKATYSREPSGRYKVALPFRKDPSNLGDSFTSAFKRFLTLEKRLSSSLDLREKYSEVFRDYLNQGHMKKSSTLDETFDVSTLAPHYFIPHHAIFKNSTTTPVRVVFDASLKTNPKSLSLNDCLFAGPRLQIDIVQLFMNFRIFEIAIIADLCQMYRQMKWLYVGRIAGKDVPVESVREYLTEINGYEEIKIKKLETKGQASPLLVM